MDGELAATAYAAPCCKLPSLWWAPGYGVPGCWPLRLRTGRVCWWVWPLAAVAVGVAAVVVVLVVVRLRINLESTEGISKIWVREPFPRWGLLRFRVRVRFVYG